MGVRKTPGPKGASMWGVWIDPTVEEIIKGHKGERGSVFAAFLGEVYWYSRWRQYTFFPANETVLEKGCLRTIAAFCEQQSDRLRKRLKG